MKRDLSQRKLPRVRLLAERTFATLERFAHIESVSGIVLLVAAAIALIWANSPFAASYHHLWHTPISIAIGSFSFSHPLHFWINDGLMAIFFLVVGMEIRYEIHAGALSNIKQATLPIVAAFGGVAVPALIYTLFNSDPARHHGWAVPTATDIAFAVGVLALLGRSIPGNVRVFLLTLAIIDDIIAIVMIALFYSAGLDYSGLAIAGAGILLVFGFQLIGIGAALAYVIPGVVIWSGFLIMGIHPTIAGVVLGLITPVLPARMHESALDKILRISNELADRYSAQNNDAGQLSQPFKQLRLARRELLPPVMRVQMALHPWVAFFIMPLFALANAGVSVDGVNLSAEGAHWVMIGVMAGLVAGKPLGIIAVSWLMVRVGLCKRPPGVSWGGIALIGLLGGIGFTMSIFIAMLAFSDENQLGAAKLGVLLGSLTAAILGIAWGKIYVRRLRAANDGGLKPDPVA
ncbi:Na+/H+ antiporter NhaA [Brenneria goodwinii]|uniref:Na+/H+ antiporter NhaA n=1 Tax=Brenneria goodwinii TaxID=1109412 RepID=UPI000EF2375E|nr:Na+/H+ antiporter NhaA [Brenneria goodwinii]MCG8158930.1 Na+/H+ antiporter NhaA [Brenneria goodwinii]MCG8163722.1 Na+/H+ antiporter NhaA [Brenneria goodwinii]MCG8166521.1 Na+/H+ antiporter NhaA [Brenneria goodwinii]MCG8170497.1 Na+/H+ antiporter NhaA [Brenneria goodwinii]MCG8177611.1 Na+/H+ antiporter NhaA [Brenneria goodwinii]